MEAPKFANRLMSARVEKGHTKRQASEEMGVSMSALEDWEFGRCLPNDSKLKTISDYTSIPLGELLAVVHQEKSDGT